MDTMNVINGRIHVGDYVAYPTQKYNKGLALKVGQVTELRPNKKAVQVRVVYNTTGLSGNAHQEVRSELCVRVDTWNINE